MKNEEIIDKSRKRAIKLMHDIGKACIRRRLNLAIYDGKIGFVDQDLNKIVMVWDAKYSSVEVKE